jgi:murein DD-endopeptidase MepM/ murein hydrolase activator NlpD
MDRMLSLVGMLCCPLSLAAQQAGVGWLGDPPRQGAFTYLVVRPAAGDGVRAVQGTLAGTPLFFTAGDGGAFVALAGVAVDAEDSVPASVTLERAGRGTTRIAALLPVSRADFPSERLTVAPQFTRPPDSALAARIAREARRARTVWEHALVTPRLWQGAFRAPRSSAVTSGYGVGRVFNGQLQSRHLGTDFDGAVGDSVVATNRGVVALVGSFYYAGRVVYVNHGAGLVSAYLHLSAVNVATGDTVVAGQLLGRVGRSGRVTGPHLHWSVKYGELSLDGATLLALPSLETIARRAR